MSESNIKAIICEYIFSSGVGLRRIFLRGGESETSPCDDVKILQLQQFKAVPD